MTQLIDAIGEQNLTWPDGPWTDTASGEEHPAVALGRQILEVLCDGSEPDELGGWRKVIDAADLVIAGAMAARVLATKEVGRLKVERGISPIDTSRERRVVGRAADAAEAAGMKREHGTSWSVALISTAHGQCIDARRAAST